jgi:hypothetical protein
MRASVIEDHLASPVPLNRRRLRRLGAQLPEGGENRPRKAAGCVCRRVVGAGRGSRPGQRWARTGLPWPVLL